MGLVYIGVSIQLKKPQFRSDWREKQVMEMSIWMFMRL